MERQNLKETLNELHQQLAEKQSPVDEETRLLLQQLATDIDRICLGDLAETEAEDSPDVPQAKQGFLDQLLSVTEEFEESHPELAETIGRVATALSRIGI